MNAADGTTLRGETSVGARLAVAGAVGYLLEWTVILVVSPPGPRGPGEPTSQLVGAYADRMGAATLAATCLAICLVGPVVFMAGLKSSLREHASDRPLLDLALAAIAISAILESAAY